jgi:alanine racemase
VESWQELDARELGAAVGMIPWEVMCRLGSRIERQYENRDKTEPDAQ